MGELTLRPAEERDISFIAALHQRSHVRDVLRAPTESEVRKAMGDAGLEQSIALLEGEPVGLLLTSEEYDWLHQIRHVAVWEPSKGIGSQLLRLAVRRALERDSVERVFLEVPASNERARRVYERIGFVLEGTWRNGYRNHAMGEFEDLCAYGLLRGEERLT